MALRVWLPLTKDLKNQGLTDINVINNGATYNTGGKLGGCYVLDTSSINIGKPLPSPCSAFTVAGWVNLLDGFITNNGFHLLSFGQTYGRVCVSKDGAALQTLIPSNAGGTAGSLCPSNMINTTIIAGEWHHYAVTYNAGFIKIYIDGNLDKEYNTSISSFAYTNNIIIGTYNAEVSKGRLNDYRLYDHALSPMEVKQLSQGLVLHYPLNRQGWGQENNIKITTVQNRGCNNFVYNSNTNEWTMTCPTGSSTWGYGIVLNDRSIAWKTGESWLVSMEVYTPRAIRWQMDINNKPDLSDISSYTGNDYDDQRVVNTNGVQGSYQLNTGWNKLWFTQRAPSAYGLTNYSTNWGVVTTNESSAIDIKIKNIKGEVIGSGLTLQPTPWCPNSSDALAITMGLNSNIEYDTSGFGNNGTWHGTHSNTSDTPKYIVSTTATGSGTTYLEGPILPAEAKTVALWIKNTSKSSNGAIFNDKTTGLQIGLLNSLLYMNSKSSTAGFTTTHWINGEWNHVVAINDNGTRSLYVNGQPETQSGASNYYIHNADNCWLWNRSYNNSYPYNGSLSDLRVYATALSADDVKSLYQNSAYIDSSGNVYGAVHSEV